MSASEINANIAGLEYSLKPWEDLKGEVEYRINELTAQLKELV